MSGYYTISAKDNMVIYGGGALGKERYRYFSRHYHVSAFFDQNAASISTKDIDIPVYTPQEGVNKLGTHIVVVVCIHNAFMHQEVAQNLYDLGIDKIIFLPMGEGYLTGPRVQMLEIYTYCCEHDIDRIREIPYYSTLVKSAFVDCIIRKSSEYIVSWCPIDLLYTEENWPDGNANIPVASFRILAEGYEFFQGRIDNADNFIQVYMPEDGQSENVGDFLQRRFNTYLMLEKEWKENHEYFMYAPVEVKWNERAYFNVLDGHNRVCFLIDKGCRWIPVRMSRADYELWLNNSVCKVICDKLEGREQQFSYHLPHPLFKYEKITKDDLCVDILCEVLRYLGKESTKINNMLEISEYEGYFAANFLRMGAKYAALIEDREETINTINQIQRLIQIGNIQIRKDVCHVEKEIELAFILKDIQGKDLENILKDESLKNCRFLVHKTYGNIDESKRILNTYGYEEYHFLLRVVEEKEVREVGIYSRLL